MKERAATRITQGGLTFFLTYLQGQEVAKPGFYNIERFEPETKEGYQRVLEGRRAKELTDFLVDALEKGEYPAIPTAAFLATEQKLEYDPDRNLLLSDLAAVCPFNVVDGQHRLEGIKAAVVDNPSLRSFQLPVTIAAELPIDHQMYHFFVINSTQKGIDQALRQRITANFIDRYNIKEMPTLPRRLRREVERRTQADATEMVEHLNNTEDSPLCGRIKLVNDQDPLRGRLNEAPLANILKQHVLSASNPISGRESPHRMSGIIVNYLEAIRRYYDERNTEGEELLLFRSSGMYFFIALSKWFFQAVYNTTEEDFTVDSLLAIFELMADEVDDDMRLVFDPPWWVSGRGGASMNRALADGYIERCKPSLQRIQRSDDRQAKI